MVLVILGLIAYSMTRQAWPWFKAEGLDIFADNGTLPRPVRAAQIYGTFLVGVIARSRADQRGDRLVRHRGRFTWLRKPIVYAVDLLAAIPSVVCGLWALRSSIRWPTSTPASRRRPATYP
jgi:ABC-type phosphate transport system permease subunit